MFGQPALAVILCEQGFVDFFVHNCMVEPQGFHVSIAVDREEVCSVAPCCLDAACLAFFFSCFFFFFRLSL